MKTKRFRKWCAIFIPTLVIILYGGWTTLGIVLGGSLIVFLLGTVIGMVTSRAIMKENALIDGLINAVTAIPRLRI